MVQKIELAAGSGASVPVTACQSCGSKDLISDLFLGYLPPVNQMHDIDSVPREQPSYPAQLLYCPDCELVQIGLIVDPKILFAPNYPYTSGTTKILHHNFADMADECASLLKIGVDDLVVDIGSNDGTLLSKFKARGHQVQGIEPTDAYKLAVKQDIPTENAFFTKSTATAVREKVGPASVVTACNCFAHIENIHEIIEGILALIDDNGVFISESHYLISLFETVQYDTIYHEHLRYYSLASLQNLLGRHGLEIFHVKRIPTHGGSIRVYAARAGSHEVKDSVTEVLAMEKGRGSMQSQLADFRAAVISSKLELTSLIRDIKKNGERIYGISAPSRASTLVNYTGIDSDMLDCVLEIKGSKKIGKYMPGTLIPVIEETRLFEDQPEYALMLAWHIADELAPKLRELGFKGKFIVPLPEPRVI
jgi:hypothetical protein